MYLVNCNIFQKTTGKHLIILDINYLPVKNKGLPDLLT